MKKYGDLSHKIAFHIGTYRSYIIITYVSSRAILYPRRACFRVFLHSFFQVLLPETSMFTIPLCLPAKVNHGDVILSYYDRFADLHLSL